MAHPWGLLAFLSTLLVVSHTTESGSPQGKRRQTSPVDTLQRPLQEVQTHMYSRDRRGLGSTMSEARFRSHRNLEALAKSKEDWMGLESLSHVRLEIGPGRDRDREPLGIRSLSQAQENDLMGMRKRRRQGHRNWNGNQFEHKKQGRQNDKRRHGKGDSIGS